jgi:hypothetical protein
MSENTSFIESVDSDYYDTEAMLVDDRHGLARTVRQLSATPLEAAAPDLLAALQVLLSRAAFSLDQSATHDGLANCQAIAAARAVIAKATA